MSLVQILQGLKSPHNETRRQAESTYNQYVKRQPLDVLKQLATTQVSSGDMGVRSICAVMLRRLVQPTSKIEITKDVQVHVQNCLIKAFNQEPVDSVRRKVCHVIAPLATRCGSGQWNALLPTTFQKLQAQSAKERVSAYFLLSKLCEYAVDMISPHVRNLLAAIQAGLERKQDMSVRIVAVEACCSWMLSTAGEDENNAMAAKHKPAFTALMPAMLTVVSDALNNGSETEAQESLKKLIELVRVDPDSCKPAIDGLTVGMMTVVGSQKLDSVTRKLALELLVQVCESAPALARKCAPLITQIVPLSVRLMFEVEEDDWEPSDYTPMDPDQDSPYIVGESALLRVTTALGKVVVPQLLKIVPALAGNADWKQRRASVVGIGAVVNGGGRFVAKAMKPHLATLLGLLVQKATKDPNQWVRYESVSAIAALATVFGPHVQENFHGVVVPALVAAMGAGNCVRVRGHAASAATVFAAPDKCEEDSIAPYANVLLGALCNLLKSGTQSVQEESLTTVACVAKVIEADFAAYYDAFMPGIKGILSGAVTKENRSLHARAIECMGLIAESVGMAKFGKDAGDAMQMIIRVQSAGLADDDPRAPQLMQCSVRICKCVGAPFAQCLPQVVPPLMRSLAEEVNYSVTDVEEGESAASGDAKMDSVVIGIRGIGDKRISLNTSAIDDKLMACNLLREYATVMRGKFMPFVDMCAKAVVQHVDFKFFEGVRSSAALTLSAMIRCATEGLRHAGKDQSYALGLLTTSIQVMTKRLEHEMKANSESDTLACFAEAIKLALEVCYRSGSDDIEHEPTCAPVLRLPKELLRPVCQLLCECANQSVQRRLAAMNEARASMGALFDESAIEAIEEELEVEEELMTEIIDAVGYLIKTHKAEMVPTFDATFGNLLSNILKGGDSMPNTLVWNAICAFDDVVEHCGSGAYKYLPVCAPRMLAGVGSTDRFVRQAAIYGVGQIAEHAREFFGKICADALGRLVQVLRRPDARTEENLGATENAVGAIGRICAYFGGRADVPIETLVPLWLSFLPLRDDMIEAYIVHRHFCTLLSSKNTALLGKSNERLAQTIKVAVEVVVEELADAQTRTHLTTALAAIRAALPAQALQGVVASIRLKHQAKARALLGV